MSVEYLDSFCRHGYMYGDGVYTHYGHASDGCERSPVSPVPTTSVVVRDMGEAIFEGFVPSDSAGARCVVRFSDGRRAIAHVTDVADRRR